MSQKSLQSQLAAAWPLAQWAEARIVVAVSGGPDSVALLRAVLAIRPLAMKERTLVAHFNHGLRGAESDGDQQFVERLAAVESVAVRSANGSFVRGASDDTASEESLRDDRYEFLLRTAHEFGARYLLTGHTADDQAETVLFRLLRGTGISGLAGIPRMRALSEAVTLVRPMLDVRRSEVLEYLTQLNQPYRIDSSNARSDYSRNRIRNELLPLLAAEHNPRIVETLITLASQAGEVASEVRGVGSWLLELGSEHTDGSVLLHLDQLPRNLPRSLLREMFVELWRRQNWPRGEMTYERWEELAEMASGSEGAKMFPGGIVARREFQSLRIITG